MSRRRRSVEENGSHLRQPGIEAEHVTSASTVIRPRAAIAALPHAARCRTVQGIDGFSAGVAPISHEILV